ncbi:hypothetical protein [Phenylobacterium sp.]|uniref:hypothetical protein n=1 Tax=Phenylobacterium sp. TaxID=1871053 RepID=UPI002F94508C
MLPVSLGGVVALGWLIDRCWKRLDEAAKAAQQAAWFWGGSTGMGLALGILSPPHGRLFSPPELPPDTLMFGGGLFVIAGGIVGWLIAWGAWWLRHR